MSLDLGNNRITLLGDPIDDRDATNKKWVRDNAPGLGQADADSLYVQQSNPNITAELDMSNHKVTNLADPSEPADSANKRWVESVLPDEIWHIMAHIKGSPGTGNYNIVHKDDKIIQNIVYRTVGNDIQLIYNFKNDLAAGIYAYNFDVRSSGHTSGTNILLYGECGGSGYNCSTLYRYWAANKSESGKKFYTVTKDSGSGKRFLLMLGSDVHVHGEFALRGQHIYNHDKPYTLNVGGDNGETYEFLK